jgi:hypothetical protein
VVLDTAPTGHTILLMDSAEAYHREVLRSRGDMPEAVRQLLPRLRDPDFTRVLIVTLAEATPVPRPSACRPTCAGRASALCLGDRSEPAGQRHGRPGAGRPRR